MIYINLLPWRERLASEAKKEFTTHISISVSIGAAIVAIWFLTNLGLIEREETIQLKLKSAIKEQNLKISEIKDLQEEIQILLERKKVVESLQNNRNQATRIFEQISLKLPPGIQLKSITQKKDIIRLNGYALNNSLISKCMTSLDSSEWFINPTLIEVKSTDIKNGNSSLKLSEFTLDITYSNPEETPLKTSDIKKGS